MRMPLSFVLITAIASGSGLALVSKDSRIIKTTLYLCILVNLFILVAGLYLAFTRRFEPFWITYMSIAIAFATLIVYTMTKYNILQSEIENRPQLI